MEKDKIKINSSKAADEYILKNDSIKKLNIECNHKIIYYKKKIKKI